MKFNTLLNELSAEDLRAIARGDVEMRVTDADFLETLAFRQCFIVPPWVVRAKPTGGLARVCKLQFLADGNLDKSRILLEVARIFRLAAQSSNDTPGIGGRFST